MIFLQFILLQLFWLFVILSAHRIDSFVLVALGVLYLIFQYFFFARSVHPFKFFISALLITIIGLFVDQAFIFFDIIKKDSYPLGLISLWIVFISYYNDIFFKFKSSPAFLNALLGGGGGSMAYWSASRLGAVEIHSGKMESYLCGSFLTWALFFPASLKFFFSESLWEKVLDSTVIFSFDRTGFFRHKKYFQNNLSEKNLTGKKILITGGTSGIGEEAARQFSHLEAHVTVTGRSLAKGHQLERECPNLSFSSMDMSDWFAVKEFANNTLSFDVVVLNAGAMPEKLEMNSEGFELQLASQLIGHYLLIDQLRLLGKLKPRARIIWVSSGGMYLKKLDLDTLFDNRNYDKVSTYANVKRAQVTLVEELSHNTHWRDYYLFSMHPGWVATNGLEVSLPVFYKLMKKRLRDVSMGADTIVWLAQAQETDLTSGGFYFDRQKVSPYLSSKFNPDTAQRKKLLTRLSELISKFSLD